MPMKGGGGGGGKDVRAGGAFVEIFGRDNLTKLLDKMRARVMAFGKFLNSAGTAALKAGAALALPLTLLLGQGVSRAAEVDKLAEAFGMSAEQMSKLAAAAEIAGVSVEEVIANQSQYQSLIDSAPSISGEDAKAATTATQEFRGALIAVQNALLPVLKTITPIITAVGQFARQNASILQIVAAVAAGLLAFGIAAKLGALAMFGLSGAFGVAAVAVKAFGAAVALVASPLGIVTVALAALGYLFVTQTDTGKRWASELGGYFTNLASLAVSTFKSIADIAGTTFGGVMDAFKAGDLALAGEIALKGLEAVWARSMTLLTRVWVDFKKLVVDAWHEMTGGAELLWEQSTSAIATEIVNLGEFMVVTFLSAIQRLLAGAAGVADAIGLDDIGDSLRGIGGLLGDVQKESTQFAGFMRKALADDLTAREAAIGGRLDAEQKARDIFRDAQIAAADETANRLEGELRELRDRAAKAVAPAGGRGGLLPSSVELPSRGELFKQARGGFAGSNTLGVFGMGDKGDSRKDLQTLAKNSMEWIKATAVLNIIAKNTEQFGLRVE